MRRVSNLVPRGVVIASIVIGLTIPAYARPERWDGWQPKIPAKVIIKLVLKALGDGLITPIP